MDALQQSHRFMRPPPPPPPMADPQQQQQPPRPQQLQGPWYSGHFQYQASLPPPHQQTQWVPHSDHQSMPPSASYPTSQHNTVAPYPAHHSQHHNHYLPPPHPQMPPPHPYSHPPQPYPHPNHQPWGNPNWAQHQGWEHPDRNIPHNNEEDWAARARAWAAAKAAMESQHPQSQFTTVGRPEEHNHVYHDQYQQAVDPHYTDIQQPSLPASSHQQFPVSLANPYRPPENHLQESTSFSPGPSSCYVSDGHISYTARDGALAADSNPVFPHQGSVSMNSSVYQQEVPSSYSSVPGKEEAGDQNEQFHKPSPLLLSSAQHGQHYVHSTLPATGRSVSMEQPHFTFGDRSAESMIDPSDRPLEFAPRFSRDHEPHPQASYTHPDQVGSVDPIAAVPSIHALTPPVAPGVVYPPIPSGPQFDPSFAAPPVPGHGAPMFGQIPGSSFRPTIPTVSAPFGLGAGTALHPTAAFPGDANGVFNVSERPKKASVPNWLREEIIKKKSVITSSSQEHFEEDPFNPTEDDGVDKSFRKGGQADSKSIDSSRSSEDEDDDDEDEVEAARTAAVNQEIKRVLTEVLLKVTDELFDEIATKVLSEDNLTVEVDHNISPPNHKVSPSPLAVPTPKASAKVLIPVKAKETEADDANGESSSGPPGDVLGLGNYASDNDDDEEIQSSSMPTTRKTEAAHLQSSNYKLSEDISVAVDHGSSRVKEPSGGRTNMEIDHNRTGPSGALHNHSAVGNGLSNNGVDEELNHTNDIPPAALKGVSVILEDKINVDGGKIVEATDALESNDVVGGIKPELQRGSINVKNSMTDDSQGREARRKSDKNDGHESRRSSSGKDFVKEAETGKTKVDEKRSDSSDPRRRDEGHVRKEKTDGRNGSKERVKDRSSKPVENVKESDSRKSSTQINSKDDRKETEKAKKISAKEDSSRKRERARDEKGDRSRQRAGRDSSRHKRRRSSSVGSRGRNSRDNSVCNHANDSSDEASEDSRQRKPHSKKHSLSPSPTRSRRRQVSRSPHSKHSQRRHSPYSSLEATRGRRSRSNSPIRRRR